MTSLRRRVRRKDPRTSVEAARKAVTASLQAMHEVERLMVDGVARIDEQIWADCRKNGYAKTLSTIQHARLALAECGILTRTGRTFPTTNGSASEEWIINEERWDELEQERHQLVDKPQTNGRIPKPKKEILVAALRELETHFQDSSSPPAVSQLMQWLRALA